jgi:hypothetical protein
MRFRALPWWGAATLALLASALVLAQADIDPETYAKVKAGMVLNFARYTEWPDTSFEEAQSPLVITVLGHDPMAIELEEMIQDVLVHDRPVEVRQLEHWSNELRTGEFDQDLIDRFHRRLLESHVLYIASEERDHLDDVREAVEDHAILSVSDLRGFAREGGMLGLAVRGGRVAFDANPDEIAGTNLKVSSKLLRLARIVTTRERRR